MGLRLVKSWVLACWWWRLDWSFVRLEAPVVATNSIILSSNKIQNVDILVPADPGPPGKMAIKMESSSITIVVSIIDAISYHNYFLNICRGFIALTIFVWVTQGEIGLYKCWLAVIEGFYEVICGVRWDIGNRGLMRGMATLPQGSQELLVVRDKVGRPQVSSG